MVYFTFSTSEQDVPTEIVKKKKTTKNKTKKQPKTAA
jgi:hypothetical protein